MPPQQPAVAMLAIIPSLPRPELARLVQRLIDRMDDMDGDPDLEGNGDEEDHTGGEDDFHNAAWRPLSWGGPGCPVSDEGGGNIDDDPHDHEPEVRLVCGIDQREPPLNLATAQHRHKLQRNLVTAKSGGLTRWVAQITKRLAEIDAEEAAIIAREGVQ